MGFFDFLKRKPKKKPENFGYQRVVDSNVKPSLSTGIPQPLPGKSGQQRHETAKVVPPVTKTKPAEMPKPPKGGGGIPKSTHATAHTPAESAARRRRRDWERDHDYDYPHYGYDPLANLTSPLGDADFDGTPNIVDNTPYTGSDSSYCAPTESSSSWTSDSNSSSCHDSGSSYDSGSSSSYDSGSSSSYDSGSSSYGD